MSVSKFIEDKYGVMTCEEYDVWKGSEQFKSFCADCPSWYDDTEQKELLSCQFERYLVESAFNHLGSLTDVMDRTINEMEKNLHFLGSIAMFGDDMKSQMAIDKAVKMKYALLILRQGTPKGITINAKVHPW